MENKKCFDLFPAALTEFLEMGESDHRPLVTHLLVDRDMPRRFFKIDERCMNKEGFKDTVCRGWRGSGQSQLLQIPLVQRLSRCRQHISVWKRNNRMNAEEKIIILRRRLDMAMTSPSSSTQESLRRNLIRLIWMRRFFGNRKVESCGCSLVIVILDTFMVLHKERGNVIRLLLYKMRLELYGEGIKTAIVAETYFQKLFTSEQVDQSHQSRYDDVFQGFQKRVTQAMNQDLTREITEEEVHTSLFQMKPSKAPGPDGFTAAFYQ